MVNVGLTWGGMEESWVLFGGVFMLLLLLLFRH